MFRSMLQFTSLCSSKNENISKSTYRKSSVEDNLVIHARSKQTEEEATNKYKFNAILTKRQVLPLKNSSLLKLYNPFSIKKFR